MLLPIICSLLLLSISIGHTATPSDLFLLPSGRHVSLNEIRKHHSTVSASHLPHILFEFNGNDSICSHHACLNIRELAPEDHIIVKKNNVGIGRSPVDIDQPTRSTRVRFGKDFTFAIDPGSKDLITAWGPALYLHPLNSLKHPGVFVNAAVLDSPCGTHANGTVIDRVREAVSRASLKSYETHGKLDDLESQSFGISPLRSAARLKQCTRELTLQLGILYDSSLCALYNMDSNKVNGFLYTLELQLSRLFVNAACVRITFSWISSSCWLREKKNIGPVYLKSNVNPVRCSKDGNCHDSQTALQYISRTLIDTFYHEPDGTFLFTGQIDNSTFGGAAYHASACNMESSSAWVAINHPIVVAHEIGHMLGAGHDLYGIMKKVINPDEPLNLSVRSQAEIRKFVELDSRSWCLQRQELYPRGFQSSYTGDFESSRTFAGLISVTFASLTSENPSDLIILFREPYESRTTLSYLVKKAISCRQPARDVLNIFPHRIDLSQTRPLQVNFPNHAHAFGIEFGHILESESRDLLVSFSFHANRSALAHYKVGYGMGRDGSPPKSWTHDISVPNLYAESVQCSSLSVGHVRNSSSIDLVYAIVDRRNHRNVLKYTIGFDIGPNGIPRDGWTKEIDVPGWYGRNTFALDISILDVDNDGKPELLVYHVTEWRSREIPYLRVGRSLGKDGQVTGGWSKFVQGEKLASQKSLLNSGMAVKKTGCPNIVVASIAEKISSESPHILYILSENMVTNELLESSEHLRHFDYFQDGCLECYTASYAQKCVKALRACSSHVHEVHLSSTETSATVQPSRMRSPAARPLRFSISKPITSSIYCTGFHYMFTDDGGCDITDRETVLAKGVELSFLDVLNDTKPEALQNIASTSLHEVPAGVGGPSKMPIVAEIIIDGKYLSREKVIDKAIRKLQSRPGYDLFTFKKLTKKNNKWYVRFAFKRKLFQT